MVALSVLELESALHCTVVARGPTSRDLSARKLKHTLSHDSSKDKIDSVLLRQKIISEWCWHLDIQQQISCS
jgi:hypothetical protein